jgi:caffeoyl-CoA O-methyltransferase
MSETSTTVGPELFKYIAAHTSQEDDFLKDLKSHATAAGLPAIWIAPEQAGFLQILLKLVQARQVVEIGTLAGYSAIAMARALPPGGQLRTIEIDRTHAEFARQWISRSDVADRIEVHQGNARHLLPDFKADSADAAFIDADKENYPFYLGECLRIVRRGGLILADNALSHGNILDARAADPMVPFMRTFNDLIAGEKRLHSIIVPLGDGCWVAVKR